MNEDIPELLDSSESARHRELARAARTLHDEVGQHLTALGLQLDLLELDCPQASEPIAAMRPSLEAAFQSIRNLSYDLNPDLVARVGLHSALERLARRAQCEFTGESMGAVPLDQAVAFHRIAECAVDNALCHAGASRIMLRAHAGPPPSLEIADDGSGFDAGVTAPGYGLLLIRRLAGRHGLTASLRSSPGQGTIWLILGV